MKTHIVTKDQLDSNNRYIGNVDLTSFAGHLEIEANLGFVLFSSLRVLGDIFAKAGSGIKAGWGIEAGEGIEAGWGIEAGSGIKAGEGITCKLKLSFRKRLFAGTSVYRDMSNEIKEIICGKIEGGTVCYGTVKELGLPDKKPAVKSLSGKTVKVELDGVSYEAVIK